MTLKLKSPFGLAKGLFFIALFVPYLAAAAVSPTASTTWDENREVHLRGEKLEYFQEGRVIQGEGRVEMDSGTMRLKADEVVLDLGANTLVAQGHVIWADQGNTVYARRVFLDLKTQKGRAEELLFRKDSWVATGDSVDKSSDQDLSLRHAQATSCLRENPHYRIAASQITVRLGDRVRADNVVVYVGMVPVFYLPFYTQSLKDPRPPFEIRPGYNKSTGAFVRGAYNYYLTDNQWGSLRLDWMDKTGTGYGLSHHYRLPGGEGSASGYYTRDKNDSNNQSWTGNLSHNQDLGHGLRLLGNADFISSYEVNQLYDLNRVDTFSNRRFLSLQSGQKDYSWNLELSDTQVLQQKLGSADPADREYVTIQRAFPSLSFNRYSKPLVPGQALYYSLSGSMLRSQVVPVTVTAAGSTFYDAGSAYDNTTAAIVPSLSYSQPLLRGTALSTNLSFSESYNRNDNEEGPGRSVSLGNATLNLHLPLRSLVTELGFRTGRQFSQMETLRFAGLTEQRLTLNETCSLNAATNLLMSTDYNLLPYVVDSDLKRLGLIRMQGLYAPSEHRSLSLVGSYHAPTGQLKTVNADINLNDPKKRWMTGGGWSWVNSRILQQSQPDPNAPPSFGFEDPRRTSDSVLVNWRASLLVNEHWSISGYQRLNLASKAIEEQAFSLKRDLHCWDLELYGRDRSYLGWQFGFTLTLRALPQIQASSNRIVSDLFDDVSFGY